MRTCIAVVALLLTQVAAAADGLVNRGFEASDSTWIWGGTLIDIMSRVGSPAGGVAAHGGSYQGEMSCTQPCSGYVYQQISGSTYRTGSGTLSVWVYSTATIPADSPSETLFVTVAAADASNATLARDDIALVGNYSIGGTWDASQVRSLPGGTWTNITVNVRPLLDSRLGSNLAAVHHVNVMFRMISILPATTIFWDDASWPLRSAPAPTATPPGGTYASAQQVSLSCAAPSPTIRYTTDGTTPTSGSPVYSSPVPVSANGTTTVKAICQSTDYLDSAAASWAYVLCIAGTACDDGNPCTYGDQCNSAGLCTGTAIACASDACASRRCNGTATCTVAYSVAGTGCDDGESCTYGDSCDGAGRCGGSRISCGPAAGPCQTVQCNGTPTCSVTWLPAGTACSGSPDTCGAVCDGVSPYCQPAE